MTIRTTTVDCNACNQHNVIAILAVYSRNSTQLSGKLFEYTVDQYNKRHNYNYNRNESNQNLYLRPTRSDPLPEAPVFYIWQVQVSNTNRRRNLLILIAAVKRCYKCNFFEIQRQFSIRGSLIYVARQTEHGGRLSNCNFVVYFRLNYKLLTELKTSFVCSF